MNQQFITLLQNILDSDITVATKEKILKHYMLPQLGRDHAIIQDTRISVGAVDRPSKEDIDIENDPTMKAEFEDTERGLNAFDAKNDIDDDEDE